MSQEIYCSTERASTQGRYQFAIDETRLFANDVPTGEIKVVLIVDDAGVMAKIPARDFIALSDVTVSPVTNRLVFQFKCYPDNSERNMRSQRQIARQKLFQDSIVWRRWIKK
jgi:hypothetical protein